MFPCGPTGQPISAQGIALGKVIEKQTTKAQRAEIAPPSVRRQHISPRWGCGVVSTAMSQAVGLGYSRLTLWATRPPFHFC